MVDVLRPGDLILSTTPGFGSQAIRDLSGGGPVSHVRIFVGEEIIGAPSIIEAVPVGGVRVRAIETALQADSVAVAVRDARVTDAESQAIIAFAQDQLGKPYNYFGIVRQGLFRMLPLVDLIVNIGTDDNQTFFCSQLVLESFSSSGVQLSPTIPAFETPNEIAELQWYGELDYVGHLKFEP